MAYLTKTELDAQLSGHLSVDVRQALIQSLINDGVYNAGPEDGTKTGVDTHQGTTSTGGPTPVTIPVTVLDSASPLIVVDSTDTNLKAIAVDNGVDSKVFVNGPGGTSSAPLFIGLGDGGNDAVQLFNAQYVNVLGGSGSDTLGGGQGFNTLNGGAGNDTIYGNDGDQTLIGGIGDDTIYAGSGHDKLYGGTGSDTSNGGDDILFGNGESTLYAGSGNDTLYGAGSDVLYGNSVNTTGHADMHVGATGIGYSGSLAGGYNILGSNSTGATDGASLVGGAGNDQLYGGQGADTLTSGSGYSYLTAGGDQSHVGETLQGGNGGDYFIDGANGNVKMYGGTGSNFYHVTGADTVVGSGSDTIWSFGTGDQSLVGGNGTDDFHIQETTGNDTITGGTGTNDNIGFQDRSSSDITSETTTAGVTTLTFTGGQTFTISGVENLYFNHADGTQDYQKLS